MLGLRPASAADAALLRRWDRQPHVLAAKSDDDRAWESELPRSPPWREQLMVEWEGRAIGFVQIIDPAREDSHCWGDVGADLRAVDIWIGEPSMIGQGHGTRTMALVLARCFAEPTVKAVLIDPLAQNQRAQRFYRRLGFRFMERRRFGKDDCCVYRLERAHYEGSSR